MSIKPNSLVPVSDIQEDAPASSSLISVDSARAVAQIQGAMMIAKRFPRDENAALNRIQSAAARKKLAEQAEYEYNKGGSSISGPSIRAAEAISQAWGNMISGITEVDRDSEKRESLMLAYAADLETNNWKFLEFRVPHAIDTKNGPKRLESGRDIYERTMNDGSRRLRNCLLAVIPGDVVDLFLEKANETLSKSDTPLKDRIGVMIKSMADLGITQPMVENKMECNAGALTERQLGQLRRIFQSIKDGFGKPEDYFSMPEKTKTDEFKKNLAPEAPAQPELTNGEPGAFHDFQAGSPVGSAAQAEPEPEKVKTKAELVSEMFDLAKRLGLSMKDIGTRCKSEFGKEPAKLAEKDIEILNMSLTSELRKKASQ